MSLERVFGCIVFTLFTFALVLSEFGLEPVWLTGAGSISLLMWIIAADAPASDA